MHKVWLKKTAFIIFAVLALTGCGKDKQAANDNVQSEIADENRTETTAQVTTAAQKQDEILIFRDVFGKEYETKIITSIQPVQYEKDKFVTTDGKMSYLAEGYDYRLGIDVSYHQGNIDWEKVKNAGYEFVILRVGYRGYGQSGVMCMDDKFYEYYKSAKQAGLEVGCYFFSQAVNEEEAKEEAEFVMNAIKDCKMDLPVVYDPENILDDDARTDDVTGEQFTKNTVLFCKMLKEQGYDCMVYSNMLWEAFQYDLTKLTEYPIWYADYEPLPQTPYHFEYWQYTNTGSVPGVAGEVDIDIQMIQNGD